MAATSPHGGATDDAWWAAFGSELRISPEREALRVATMAEDLEAWTKLLTHVVADSMKAMGWTAAGKGRRGAKLPVTRQEYLGIDVMGFGAAAEAWPLPMAAVELENGRSDREVAYSLWKVLSVRATLRVVFAYRRNWEDGRELTSALSEAFFRSVPHERRIVVDGPVLVVLGCRGEGDFFPSGFFKRWRLEGNTGRFERVD